MKSTPTGAVPGPQSGCCELCHPSPAKQSNSAAFYNDRDSGELSGTIRARATQSETTPGRTRTCSLRIRRKLLPVFNDGGANDLGQGEIRVTAPVTGEAEISALSRPVEPASIVNLFGPAVETPAGAIQAHGGRPVDAVAEAPADADLAKIVVAWPTLPVAIRAGIIAMVRAASTGQ
jgi:hypothetical protein